MTVWFVGAGPGAPDLLTVRAHRLLAAAPVVLYAGSLVPPEVLAGTRPGARLVDTAELDLDAITGRPRRGARGRARRGAAAQRRPVDLQCGGRADPQARRRGRAVADRPWRARLRRRRGRAAAGADPARGRPDRGADQDLGPGDPDAARRGPGRARRHRLHPGAAPGGAEHRPGRRDLLPHYGADCPAAVVARASWPDEAVLRCTLGELAGAGPRGGHPPHGDHRHRARCSRPAASRRATCTRPAATARRAAARRCHGHETAAHHRDRRRRPRAGHRAGDQGPQPGRRVLRHRQGRGQAGPHAAAAGDLRAVHRRPAVPHGARP